MLGQRTRAESLREKKRYSGVRSSDLNRLLIEGAIRRAELKGYE
jgi:hypothetical protein